VAELAISAWCRASAVFRCNVGDAQNHHSSAGSVGRPGLRVGGGWRFSTVNPWVPGLEVRTARGFVSTVRPMVGLLGPARGPARLRSAPRARGAAAGGSSPRRAGRASPLCPRSVDWDGFSATPTRHLHCAARAWFRWARRAGSPQPPLRGREGDVSRRPGAASGRPVAAGGAEGGRVPPSCLPAVLWWCGTPSP
jgi:hypothetical protein